MPKKRLKLYTESYGPAHCQRPAGCGERFMGEDMAEVVLKDDPEKTHYIIHAACFDSKRMEIA